MLHWHCGNKPGSGQCPKSCSLNRQGGPFREEKEIKTLILQWFSEVLYAVLSSLGLFTDSRCKEKTLLVQAVSWSKITETLKANVNVLRSCSVLIKPSVLAGTWCGSQPERDWWRWLCGNFVWKRRDRKEKSLGTYCQMDFSLYQFILKQYRYKENTVTIVGAVLTSTLIFLCLFFSDFKAIPRQVLHREWGLLKSLAS